MRRVLLLTAAIALHASTAGAAVVQLRPFTPGGPLAQLQVIALPAETNVLALTAAGDGSVVVADAAAPLYAGAGCAGGGATVRCTPAAGLVVVVTGGAGSRRVSLEQLAGYERGELAGGAGADALLGGVADDDLTGGAGDDLLSGGPGADRISPGPGADFVRGGTGTDRVDFGAQDAPMTITLDDLPGDGAPGEGDDIGADVEAVRGGRGPDRIVGSPAADDLDGAEGADDLDGGPGDDVLVDQGYEDAGRVTGGPGRDRITAALGSTVDARDGERDTVRCDEGLARPLLADPFDVLERCVPPVEIAARRTRVRGGRVPVRLTCAAVAQDCRVRLELRRGPVRLARRTVTRGAGTSTVRLRLGARGRALVSAGEVRACLSATSVRTAPAAEAATGCVRIVLAGGA